MSEAAGEPCDLSALFDRYKERLRRTVRLRLDPRLTGIVDSSGVLKLAREEIDRRVAEATGNTAGSFLWLRQIVGEVMLRLHQHRLGDLDYRVDKPTANKAYQSAVAIRERILECASLTVKQDSRVAWYAHTQGLAAFRAGDLETARRAALESERLPWGNAGILNQVALSLIDLREGQAETARTRFARARVSLDVPPTIRPAAGRIFVMDWLEFQVLRPQIEGPLFDRVFPVDPFDH